MSISKLKKQEMLDILNSAFNLNLESCLVTMDDLKHMMKCYKQGDIIKHVHDCTQDELKQAKFITYGLRAIPTNEKPVELKEFCLEVELNVKGNFYIKAPTLEKAKELVQKQSFLLKDELTNQFMTTEYKKFIVEKNQIEIK